MWMVFLSANESVNLPPATGMCGSGGGRSRSCRRRGSTTWASPPWRRRRTHRSCLPSHFTIGTAGHRGGRRVVVRNGRRVQNRCERLDLAVDGLDSGGFLRSSSLIVCGRRHGPPSVVEVLIPRPGDQRMPDGGATLPEGSAVHPGRRFGERPAGSINGQTACRSRPRVKLPTAWVTSLP